jgi:hypothetical protein
MTKVSQISKEDLKPVVAAREKAMDVAKIAEQAMKDARLAELEFKVEIQQLYIAKGLDMNCRVDVSTGAVSWPEEKPEAKVETPETPTPKKVAYFQGTEEPKKPARRGKREEVIDAEFVKKDKA